ncbi:glycine betaine/proline transport system permease protein [Desulfocicer vacuolatum DSM 3385]|uniref:Glycine betaine/proline transport system permease protein n=1 Tax=Desulfocicer vacuolatum DSM 3385 TaxID=1121400 RepID=A0A1W2AVP8_9BACT|nr:ABC transporter permease subunit [Desulfocicer vacuolatum]SMC64268.1 glycine betaine/proline transport system permease protein [Desulfocicer vacuolatum DSM 3385]
MESAYFSIGKYIATLVDWLNVNYPVPFELLSAAMEGCVKFLEMLLITPHASIIMIVFSLAAWKIAGGKVAGITFLGLLFCFAMNLWKATMLTTALVMVSTAAALLVAIPLGIWSATNKTVDNITRPIMDLMQTLPPWVYLIPAVILFSLGRAPAVIATAVFAIPPALRLTSLGIKGVPSDQLEVGKAFGASHSQVIWKIQIPAALPSIMAGVNQCIMMSLSMVVLAGLIGAGGLGGEVVRGLTRMMIGVGVRSGLAIVILAIIFDRVTQGMVTMSRR